MAVAADEVERERERREREIISWRSSARKSRMGTITVVGVVLVAVMAWYLATDPFKISISSNFPEFKPQTMPTPPYDPVRNFTRDNQNRLQQAEVKWKDEFVGPESIAFDLQGRGPYTGVSDGRVIRWDGPELGWTTFATTSNKRY